jgi:hypothetical protein
VSSRKTLAGLGLGLLLLALFAAGAQAEYGINGLQVSAINRDGSIDRQAGSHPYEYVVRFHTNLDAEGTPEGILGRLVADLPPGLVGDPRAVPQCSGADFEGLQPSCPGATQVGIVEAKPVGGLPVVNVPLYNLIPPNGVPASFGFSLFSVSSFEEASLRPSDYGISVSDIILPSATELRLQSVTERVWGEPDDPAHDFQRECRGPEDEIIKGCSAEGGKPFLTLPTSCTGPLRTTATIYSVEEPTVPRTETVESLDSGGNPAGLTGCGQTPFVPSLEAQPETSSGDSPTGLHTEFHIPQNEEPGQLAAANIKDVKLTLPAGLVLNPSTASGLAACSEAQVGLGSSAPVSCPAASKVGTVQVDTPLIDHPLPGSVYIAKQGENPFESLIALYIAIEDPIRGIVVKLPGKVEPDPQTGQLVVTFKENPQLPFEDFRVDLPGGPRAALTTPSTCGTYTTTSDLTPWSAPEGEVAHPSDSFEINGGCASGEAQLPDRPSFEAGTVSPVAGVFSPFVFKIAREDGTQHLGAINTTLPEGLLGRLAGVSYCSEAQIAAATARSGEGQGALEQSSPSCPESSQVGVVNITAGAGSQPFAVQGKAYLAGPYKNAPLSLAVVTPAVAGPFDLGTVVVRVALYIDQNTAQIRAVSDPLPTILDGIPLDVRSVSLSMNRAGFTFNPTSCEPMTVGGEAISTLNQTIGLSNRFQVGGCQGLPFKPTMTISAQGKTSKANGAGLTVKVSQKPGEADIHKVDLTLPKVLPARLTTLQQACTEVQFNTNPAGCPPGSFIGTAKAVTPILSVPLTGPAILVSHGGAAFPDVVFLLQANERGADIRIDLDGKTDIKKGVTYSRFETVPDAPIASFETSLPEGPHSVLAATGNLCASKLSIPTVLLGQNGTLVNQSTKVTVTGCPKARVLTRAQKLALALKACHKKPKGSKRQACERQARKKYGPLKKAKKK